MELFEALLMIALFIGLCVLGVWYANYATDKERHQYEEAKRIEREKSEFESRIRNEYREKERALQEKQLELDRQKDQIEREKRFIYDCSGEKKIVRFVKDNIDDYMEEIPAPYLAFIVGMTRAYHTALIKVAEITKEEFPEFQVSPNFSVNLASFLVYYAHSIAWKYDGEFHDVSHSVEEALEKMFLLCGFNEHLDATNLNTEFCLFHDVGFFLSVHHDEIQPFRYWDSYILSDSVLLDDSIRSVFNIFMDASFFSFFFHSKNYQEVYSLSINHKSPAITSAQEFFLESMEDFLSDFKNDLIEAFEQDFSEAKRLEFDATDNDELAFIYGYDSKDYKLLNYFYPYSPY